MFRVIRQIVLITKGNMERDLKLFVLPNTWFNLENFWTTQPTELTTIERKENGHRRFVLRSISFNRGNSLATLPTKSIMEPRKLNECSHFAHLSRLLRVEILMGQRRIELISFGNKEDEVRQFDLKAIRCKQDLSTANPLIRLTSNQRRLIFKVLGYLVIFYYYYYLRVSEARLFVHLSTQFRVESSMETPPIRWISRGNRSADFLCHLTEQVRALFRVKK